jgi:hypothetical protein
MDIGAGTDSSDDIQTQVLQTTLAEVATLRQAAASSNQGDDDASERPDCCVICLDTISDPCAALPCAHSHFDLLCLLSWLEQRPACPLCKAGVYKVRYADASKGESIYRVPNAPRNRNRAATSDADTRSFTDPSTRGSAFVHNGLGRYTDRRCSRRGHHRPRSPPTPDEAIQRRRYIYRHQLYSLRTSAILPLPTQYPLNDNTNPCNPPTSRCRIQSPLAVPAAATHTKPVLVDAASGVTRPPMDSARTAGVFLPL